MPTYDLVVKNVRVVRPDPNVPVTLQAIGVKDGKFAKIGDIDDSEVYIFKTFFNNKKTHR